MKTYALPKVALPCALLLFSAVPRAFADDHDKKTDVTITAPVEVPGGVVLQPGTYMFKLMEITGNRHVVQISSEDGKRTYAITMTAAATRVTPTDKTVLTFYEMPAGSPQAVRRWFWPGDVDGQEFLYPHKRAAEISKITKQTVPEAPEEQPVAANTPAPAADVTAAPAPEPTPNPLVASAAVTTTSSQVAATEPVPATPPAPEPEVVAQATPPAPAPSRTYSDAAPSQNSSDNSTLPQTASELPLAALIGFLSLAAAMVLRRLVRA